MLLQVLLLCLLLACSAQEPQVPLIRLNSEVVTRSQAVLAVGGPFALACEGSGSASSVSWSTSAVRPPRSPLGGSFSIQRSLAEHTGTYTCVERNQNQNQNRTLSSHVHVFVKDPANLFVFPRNPDDVMEGADLHLGCVLTDPGATDLALRLADGGALPSDLNYTADPLRGVVIRQARANHKGRYVCSARIGGVEHKSKPFFVKVFPKPQPPWVSVETEEYVRVAGEPLRITCFASSPSHFFRVTWTHSSLKTLEWAETSFKSPLNGKWVVVNSTVSVPAVSHAHAGTFTCTASNKGGANATSARLAVVDEPYLRVQTESSPWSNASLDQETGVRGSGGRLVEVREGEDLELRVQMEAYPPVLSMLWDTPTSLSSSPRDQAFSRTNHRFEAILQVKRLRRGDGGLYLLRYRSKLFNDSVHFHVRVLWKPSALIRLGNSSTLTCIATGNRLPTILWYQCPGIRDTCGGNRTLLVQPRPETTYADDGEEEARSRLELRSATENVTVECVAENDVGTARDVFVSYHIRSVSAASADVMMLSSSPVLIGACSAAGLLLLLLLVLLYKYRQKPKYEIRWKIIETSDGNNYRFIDPTQLPYNQQWEFPRERLTLGSVLGAGAFGKVVEGTAYGLGNDDSVTRVAVKMLKPSAHSEEREALMSELKILSHLGHHDNIVNLLGACTQGGPMLVITEYCSHGDLLNFLRRRAQDFMDTILSSPTVLEDRELYKNMAAQQARIRSDSGISCSDSDYLDMQQIGAQPHGPLGCWSLDIDNLLVLSYQVAQGMGFLASRNCIHRDVAARNVLLTEEGVAKICDFGLARDVMNDANYVVKGNARLPVKWMAPESIFDCVYTVQSDVWSYGILLWEIFSLGNSPYPIMAVDARFYKMIKDGRHMSRPDFSPPEMFSIMTQCWNLEPTERPTFTTIAQLIQDLLPQETHQTYSNMQGSAAVQEKGEEDEEEEEEEEGQSTKSCEEDCDRQTVTHEEEEQPLMKSNNYQVC